MIFYFGYTSNLERTVYLERANPQYLPARDILPGKYWLNVTNQGNTTSLAHKLKFSLMFFKLISFFIFLSANISSRVLCFADDFF